MASNSTILHAIEIKKRSGELPEDLIREVVTGFTSGEIPDYQMSALLMAILIQGMSFAETLALTAAMADSGRRYSFPECVDKHSTGGIGDKISLTALPLVAACGAPVAKLSGRGLGHTGGTIDKLESIPGFTCALSSDRFERQVEEVGFAIMEASDAAPADKAIYALRDATGTVDSLPLIGSSIVSKKAATGAGHVLYDVKQGSGAFMKTGAEARQLAHLLVQLSNSMEVKASALITGMDQPLGSAVGNALEVRESIRFLKSEPVPLDLSLLARSIAIRLLALKGVREPEEAVQRALSSGAAYEKFEEFVRAQGGDVTMLEKLPVSSDVQEIHAPQEGYVSTVDAIGVGKAALALGAGREKKGDRIDPGAGVNVLVKVGDRVQEGQTVAVVHGQQGKEQAVSLINTALRVADEPVEPPAVILEEVF